MCHFKFLSLRIFACPNIFHLHHLPYPKGKKISHQRWPYLRVIQRFKCNTITFFAQLWNMKKNPCIFIAALAHSALCRRWYAKESWSNYSLCERPRLTSFKYFIRSTEFDKNFWEYFLKFSATAGSKKWLFGDIVLEM